MARLLVGPGCGPIKMTWAWHPAWSAGIAEVPFVCESVYCFHLQGRSKWFAQVPLWIAPPMIILRRIKSRAAKPSQLRTRFIPHKEPCGKTQSATYSFYSSVRTNLASIPSAISSVQKEWSSTEKEWSAGKEALTEYTVDMPISRLDDFQRKCLSFFFRNCFSRDHCRSLMTTRFVTFPHSD
jgi:hypothetical protein